MFDNLKKEEQELLLQNPLFSGFTADTIDKALRCLKASKKNVAKDRVVYPIGEKPVKAALIMKGAVDVSEYCRDGRHILISRLPAGMLVADDMVCNGSVNTEFDIRTSEDSELLFIYLPSRDNRSQAGCPYFNILLQNLIYSMAEKNIILSDKVRMLGMKSLRMKLLHYFENLSRAQQSNRINLNCTREVLASIVAADRSAVSRELNHMQEDGLIVLKKNSIELIA